VESDLDAFADLVADPEVQEFLGGSQDRVTAWWTMARILGHEVLRGWSHNAIIEKASGRLIGRSGLWQPEGWPGVEVGWVLARNRWGNGFATEAAIAWRDWAFNWLRLRELISVIDLGNTRSEYVAKRIGHRYLRTEVVDGRESLIYVQSRPNF
jgi:RimJ/RimL family protein N-acetyltransferase